MWQPNLIYINMPDKMHLRWHCASIKSLFHYFKLIQYIKNGVKSVGRGVEI